MRTAPIRDDLGWGLFVREMRLYSTENDFPDKLGEGLLC